MFTRNKKWIDGQANLIYKIFKQFCKVLKKEKEISSYHAYMQDKLLCHLKKYMYQNN